MSQHIQDYTPGPELLANRIILITGAGDGIGAAVAKACAAHGATVILLGRTIRKLEQVYDAIEQAGHPQPAIYPMNLEGAAPKDYEDLAETLEKEFGHLDGILHNAANPGTLTPLGQYDLEMWSKVMQVNLNAPFLLTRAVLDLLKASDDASVVFNSDRVGRRGKAYWGAYGIAKAAAENMMQVFADELETNTSIRVNSIDPGAVNTAMRRRYYPGEQYTDNPKPEQVVGPFLYLLGPDSRGHSGEQFTAPPHNG